MSMEERIEEGAVERLGREKDEKVDEVRKERAREAQRIVGRAGNEKNETIEREQE